MAKWEYTVPDARYIRIANAMCTPKGDGMGQVCMKERPKGTACVQIEVHYVDKDGKQIGDTLGFELLTSEAAKGITAIPLPTKANES